MKKLPFFGLADFPEGTSPKRPYMKIVTPSLWCFAYAFINFSIILTSFQKKYVHSWFNCTKGKSIKHPYIYIIIFCDALHPFR